ncbi:MAG: hypothetical protein ACRDAW_01150, partial [Metamycoplasmataceae bacterium]
FWIIFIYYKWFLYLLNINKIKNEGTILNFSVIKLTFYLSFKNKLISYFYKYFSFFICYNFKDHYSI